jgi:hypothetical protein
VICGVGKIQDAMVAAVPRRSEKNNLQAKIFRRLARSAAANSAYIWTKCDCGPLQTLMSIRCWKPNKRNLKSDGGAVQTLT